MKIYFMKQKALDSLQAEVADNLNKYQSSSFWMDEHFINQNMPKYYFDTGIEVADYQLISGGPETDFQNAKIVFEAFKNKLNPVQASDLRLWAYLAHVQHWEYMSHRWKIDIPDEEDDEGSEERKKSPREKMIDNFNIIVYSQTADYFSTRTIDIHRNWFSCINSVQIHQLFDHICCRLSIHLLYQKYFSML